MKFQIVYFDDQIQNIEAYQAVYRDTFNIAGYTDPAEYSQVLAIHKPHGILLDLHMPKLDGLALYSRITNCPSYNGCPIFFISGDVSDESRLKSIQSGAIDFFTRTISKEELAVRMVNKIKMYLQGSALIDIGNLQLNSESFNILVNGKPSDLTLIETRILISLIKALPDAVDKDELILKIWGESSTKGKINVHLSNMKIKLRDWNHEIRVKGNALSIIPS